MTASPLIERLEFPSAAPALPDVETAPPFASTVARLPETERPLPERVPQTSGTAEWEQIAAGVLAGFGGGIVATFLLALIVL